MRRRSLLCGALAPGLAMLSCARRQAGAGRIPLRVALAQHLTMSPFYMGWEAGYFAQEGFDVELTKELPGVQSIPLLAAGKLDVGFVGLSPGLLNAVARGARIRIVAGREIAAPACSLNGKIYVSSREFPDGIPDLRKLRRRRIAVSSASPFGLFCLDKLLEQVGMSRTDVEIRQLGANDRIPALRAGGVDAVMSTSTDLSPLLRPLQIAPGPALADVLPNFQFSYIAFGAGLLDGNVQRGARFLHAYFRGARDFLAGKSPAFMDEFAKSSNLDPALVRAGCRDSFEHEGRIHTNDMQTYMDWAASHGHILSPMRAESLIDTRFLDAALRIS